MVVLPTAFPVSTFRHYIHTYISSASVRFTIYSPITIRASRPRLATSQQAFQSKALFTATAEPNPPRRPNNPPVGAPLLETNRIQQRSEAISSTVAAGAVPREDCGYVTPLPSSPPPHPRRYRLRSSKAARRGVLRH